MYQMTDTYKVMDRVWAGTAEAGTQALREALANCALQFCAPTGGPSTEYHDFVAETIREFLRECPDCPPGDPCECICHKPEKSIIMHDQACCSPCIECEQRVVTYEQRRE